MNHYMKVFTIVLLATSCALAGDIDTQQMVKTAGLLRSHDTRERTKGHLIMVEGLQQETQFIGLLTNLEIRTQHPDVMGATITILGEMKSTNSVDLIAGMLLYNIETGRDFSTDTDAEWKEASRHGPPAGIALIVCPAWESLMKIGDASIRPLLSEISSQHWRGDRKQYAFFLAYGALRGIVNRDNMKMYRIIETYKETLNPPATTEINEFLAYCRKQDAQNVGP